MNIDFSAASGPPPRKGDSVGFGSTVDAMKIGLRAHYAKTGQHQVIAEASPPRVLSEGHANHEVGPSVTKDALKVGLRAWYKKHNKPLHETTTAMSVGDGTERMLGGGTFAVPGSPRYHRKKKEENGTSLRADIQAIEDAVEKALSGLSNRRIVSANESDEFRGLLADALTRFVLRGDRSYLKDALMHASLLESRFIGKPLPETGEKLTPMNDLGETFKNQMSENSPMVEMIANQLSSGMPLNVVVNNVVAAHNSTNNDKIRQILSNAHDILVGLR